MCLMEYMVGLITLISIIHSKNTNYCIYQLLFIETIVSINYNLYIYISTTIINEI